MIPLRTCSTASSRSASYIELTLRFSFIVGANRNDLDTVSVRNVDGKLEPFAQYMNEHRIRAFLVIRNDTSSEIPARRHQLIFETYGALAAGDSFELVNDHDPKPLYYQLAAEHPGQFTWEPLEQGPETWRISIGRPETS